jgi:DNA polymerase-1
MRREQAEEEAVALSFDNYETILEESQLIAWIEKLKKAPVFAFDTETDSLDNISANMVGLSFATEPGMRPMFLWRTITWMRRSRSP